MGLSLDTGVGKQKQTASTASGSQPQRVLEYLSVSGGGVLETVVSVHVSVGWKFSLKGRVARGVARIPMVPRRVHEACLGPRAHGNAVCP